jgi:uncharacterized protein (DUF58 family)
MLMPSYDELVSFRKETDPIEKKVKLKVASNTSGGHASLFKGRGLDFSEFREYSPGDDIRSIDWRVTARKGRPHTKIFVEERERSVFIIVDMNRYMQFGTRGTFKSVQAARAAAFLAWTAHHLKDKTGAILFGQIPEGIQFLPARSSRKSIWQLLKILCEPSLPQSVEIKIEDALEEARRRIPTGSSVFIISDFYAVSADFKKSAGILSRKCEVSFVKVNDPADRVLPSADQIRFSDEAGQWLEVNTSDLKSNELYHQLWNKSDAILKELAHRNRIKILRISTSGNISEELFRESTLPLRRAAR